MEEYLRKKNSLVKKFNKTLGRILKKKKFFSEKI